MDEWHEQDRFSDDGCPNHDEEVHRPSSNPTPVMQKQSEVRKRLRMKRKHKIMVHSITIAVITLSLIYEGGKSADYCFLALSIMCEFS